MDAQHVVRRDDAIALRGDERDAGVQQRLLRGQHVEGGALADLGFLADAVERDFRRGHGRLAGNELRLGGLELAPGRHDRGAHLIACQIGLQARLPELLLRLPDRRVFRAALVDRHVELAGERRR